MEFEGRKAWVTGASSGIGEAVARELSARGASLILSGRREDALKKLAAELKGETMILPFEATDFEALPGIVETALAWRGGVDLLFNNAGISQRSLALETDFSVYRAMMDIDFFAPVRLTQLTLPHMVARRSGHIAIVSSLAGKIGSPMRTGYCAAKHACVGYFDALRAEIELAHGIGVSVILPGFVKTNLPFIALNGQGGLHGQADPNIDNGLPVEYAARLIVEALARDQREIIVADERLTMAAKLRGDNPDALFALMAAEGARLAGSKSGS